MRKFTRETFFDVSTLAAQRDHQETERREFKPVEIGRWDYTSGQRIDDKGVENADTRSRASVVKGIFEEFRR